MIQAEFRRMIFSDPALARHQVFMPGATIAEIVAAFAPPIEFEHYGAVYLKRGEHDLGHRVEREHWHRVRPKAGAALFISSVPQGPDGENLFALVAAVALVALTMWAASPAGIAFLAPAFGGSTTAAYVAVAAIGVGGSAAISYLTRPRAGAPQPAADPASPRALGVAGIAQNPIAPHHQVPGVLAREIRVSPPLLARPFTTIENGDQVLHGIAGLCGPCSISGLKVDTTDVADLPAGVFEYEIREGWADDPPLTLVTLSGFEETLNLPMSTHRLDTDQATLIAPASGSYPKPHIFRSARNTKRFRIMLNFGGGLAYFDNGNEVAVALRLRIRRVGEVSWVYLPELHFNTSRREGFRQEIWLKWGGAAEEAALMAEFAANPNTPWKRRYFVNPEWTADAYFAAGYSGDTASNGPHVYCGRDGVHIHLDHDQFPIGRYDVEIVRSFADAASGFSDTSYVAGGGLFTSRTVSGTTESIPAQGNVTAGVAIESHTSFRDEYPIRARGIAMIAFKARNLQVNSLSALFGSYVPTWNGADWNDVAVSGNPAALTRHVLTGRLNKRPVPATRMESELSDFFQHCVDHELECNHVQTEGSVEQAAALAAMCGDGLLRRSDKWGVVIDRDRSEETLAGMFTPSNMTGPLTVTKRFVTGARALLPSFLDPERDYQSREVDRPVIDDGVPSSQSGPAAGGFRSFAQTTWFELLRLVPDVQPFVDENDDQAMTAEYIRELVRSAKAAGIKRIITAYDNYGKFWFFPRASYPDDYDSGEAGDFWHDAAGAPAGVENFEPIGVIIDECHAQGMECIVGLSRNGDLFLLGDMAAYILGLRPAADLTFSHTSGSARTVTASFSIFTSFDIGRTIMPDAGGAAVIRAVAGTTATVDITSALSSTSAASGDWKTVFSDIGVAGQNDLTLSATSGVGVTCDVVAAIFVGGEVGKIMEEVGGPGRAQVTAVANLNPDGFTYARLILTVTTPFSGTALAAGGWKIGDPITTRQSRAISMTLQEAQELHTLYPDLDGFYLAHEPGWLKSDVPEYFIPVTITGSAPYPPLRSYGKPIIAAPANLIDLGIRWTDDDAAAAAQLFVDSGVDIFLHQFATGAGFNYESLMYGFEAEQEETLEQLEQVMQGRAAAEAASKLLTDTPPVHWANMEDWSMAGPTYTNAYPIDPTRLNILDRVQTIANRYFAETAWYAWMGYVWDGSESLRPADDFAGVTDYGTRARRMSDYIMASYGAGQQAPASPAADMLIEAVHYDGLASEALATRRARLDLRRARLRTLKYAWAVGQTHLKNKKGHLVGLAHDILIDTFGTGRVREWTSAGGNLTDVTLNTNCSDLPVAGYGGLFAVDRVLTLGEFFALGGPKVGLQIELPDASVVTIPISGVSDRTLIVEGEVAVPAGLKPTLLAAVGIRERETRRVIITDVAPKDDLYAQIEAVDLAPDIFKGL